MISIINKYSHSKQSDQKARHQKVC